MLGNVAQQQRGLVMPKIDKNVPIPKGLSVGDETKSYHSKYPFSKMEIGDSFFVPHDQGAFVVGSAASGYGRRHGKKFISRKTHDPYGVRIWRVA
jgi:hypothetical protein